MTKIIAKHILFLKPLGSAFLRDRKRGRPLFNDGIHVVEVNTSRYRLLMRPTLKLLYLRCSYM